MAEKGAHLAATFVKKPSIFELIAQDSLANTFYPAFRHVANYLVNQNPVRYSYLIKWFEELYLGFNVVLQYHYLKNYDATFSERFYSLRRILINSNNPNTKLSTKHKMLSILFSVSLPYIRNKLKNIVQNIENREEDEFQRKVPKKYHSMLLKYYKVLHMIVETISIIYYLRYMIGKSETHSLLLRLAGLTLVYCHEPFQATTWKNVIKDIISGNWKSSIHLISLTKEFFGRSLEIMAFFIQFLSWWHSEQLQSKLTAFPIPAAPNQIKKENEISYNNICPLCKKPFKIPTALTVSGYVFCYKCIREFVLVKKKCPITNYPVNADKLVRIYDTGFNK